MTVHSWPKMPRDHVEAAFRNIDAAKSELLERAVDLEANVETAAVIYRFWEAFIIECHRLSDQVPFAGIPEEPVPRMKHVDQAMSETYHFKVFWAAVIRRTLMDYWENS